MINRKSFILLVILLTKIQFTLEYFLNISALANEWYVILVDIPVKSGYKNWVLCPDDGYPSKSFHF